MREPVVTFIGAGNIARAIVTGLVSNGFKSKNIWMTNPSSEKLAYFRNQFKVNTTQDNAVGAEHADVIVLSVKPRQIPGICAELKDIIVAKKPLIVSVAVGVTDALLQRWLAPEIPIVRAMPNTPAMVQAGATGLYANSYVDETQKNIAESIFRAVGLAVWLEKEEHIDLVIAASGSGPAYFFYLMEAMSQAVESMGLPAALAQPLVTQTALGAARMAMETEQDVTTLRRLVTSPQGTTEQAIKVFENHQLKGIVADALKAASQRSKELTALLEE